MGKRGTNSPPFSSFAPLPQGQWWRNPLSEQALASSAKKKKKRCVGGLIPGKMCRMVVHEAGTAILHPIDEWKHEQQGRWEFLIMRKVTFLGCVVGALVFSALRVSAAGVQEDFEGYSGSNTTDWLFTTDTALAASSPTWFATNIGDPGDGTQAGYFILNDHDLNGGANFVSGDHVYFESNSSSLVGGGDPTSFSAALAFVPMDADLTVDSVDYYIYTNDGTDDYYYQASVTPLPSNPSVLQTYPSVGMVGSSDTWDGYKYNTGTGNWDSLGSTTLTSAITDDLTGVGIDMALSGDLTGATDYMTIWVDDVVVPEPSALMLACFGALGFLVRRRRRQG